MKNFVPTRLAGEFSACAVIMHKVIVKASLQACFMFLSVFFGIEGAQKTPFFREDNQSNLSNK